MAISAELVDVVALVLKKPVTEVGNHLRNLRKAGLVSLAGRGASAAAMTADDAINLVLAVIGSERVKDSISTTQKLATLPVIEHRVNYRHKEWSQHQARTQRPLLVLPQDHTLQDALRTLFGIVSLCLGHDTENTGAHASLPTFTRAPPTFHVKIFYPRYKALIQVSLRGIAREYWTYELPHGASVAGRSEFSTGDLVQMRGFSDVTVTQICQLLGGRK
jgi:hypothetical protein